MVDDNKRFPFEKANKLDSPERHERQPADRLVNLIFEDAPGVVLEIGVGTGYFALPIAKRMVTGKMIGVDVEPRMLDIVRQRGQQAGVADRLELHVAGNDRIPLPNGSADVVLMVNLYHELENRTAYLAEVRRSLARGGKLYLSDWDPRGTKDAGPPANQRIDVAVVQRELTEAGYIAVSRHDLYKDFYVLRAGRG